MDSTGHVVLGEPGQPKKGKAPKAARSSDPVDLDFGRMLKSVPMPVKIIGALALVVMLSYALGLRIPKFGASIPDDLLSRGGYVAEAFIDEKPSLLRKIAAPGTESEVGQWYEELRPQFDYTGPKRQGNIVLVTGSIEEEDAAGGTALVNLNLSPPQPNVKKGERDKPGYWPGYRVNGTFVMPTYWTMGEDGKWLLDGARTYASIQEAQASPGTAQ